MPKHNQMGGVSPRVGKQVGPRSGNGGRVVMPQPMERRKGEVLTGGKRAPREQAKYIGN